MTKNIEKWLLIAALISGSAVVTGCKEDQEEQTQAKLTLVGQNPILYATTQRFVQVKAAGEWTLSVVFNTDETAWCSVNPTSGAGDKNNVILTLTKNEGEESRIANLQLKTQDGTTTLAIEQFDESYTDVPPVNPPITKVDKLVKNPDWLELPVATEPYNGQSAVVTHGNTVGGKYVRNYTILYDTTKFLAYWVAYPLSTSYIGSFDRTDKWIYDPKIPAAYQINVTGKSYPDKSAPGPYDRGHQLPSGDRTASTAENAQTFFVTNQTPQVASFNQGIWKSLEDKIRGYAGAADTVYVVTGAHLGSNYVTTPDNSTPAKAIPIPTHYYKVLVSYTKSTSTYKAIGFWFENRPYPAPNNKPSLANAKTVKQIEELTGFTFFPLLPDPAIKETFNGQDWGLQ